MTSNLPSSTLEERLFKHLVLLKMNSDHLEICQCYMCLGKKLASERIDILQSGKIVSWSTTPTTPTTNKGFFSRLRDEWFR